MMENLYIREIREDGYSMMENERENFYIREIREEGYMENQNQMINEMNDEIENKILRDAKLERKIYEGDKLIYEINNIYRKYGLKINKNNVTKKKLEEIIYDMIRYNFNNEKNENLYKKDLKKDLIDFKFRNDDYDIEKICENLSKNDFRIPKKYKYKKNLAKFIRRMYREYKWLRTNNFKFLITENFKKFEEIEKIKLNRNGLVLCYNGTKIVCIYLFYLIDNYLDDIIDSLIPYVYNNYEEIELYGVLSEKRYLDNRLKDKRIEEKID